MTDARKACAELCQVSQLALWLATRGRAAGLHQTPLFALPGSKSSATNPFVVQERAEPAWGKRAENTSKPGS